jgi:NAD(P)-dependent dehydrogenase (short-subunit alcohol dehydrogenase family)
MPSTPSVDCSLGHHRRRRDRDARDVAHRGPHDLDAFRQVIDLNLFATFNIDRLGAWHVIGNESEHGEHEVIVNIASVATYEGQIAYTAAKAGVSGMCPTMARDPGSLGIRILAIAPRLFATGLTAMVPDEMAAMLTRDAAFPKRMGHPEEYAKLVLAIIDNPMLNG